MLYNRLRLPVGLGLLLGLLFGAGPAFGAIEQQNFPDREQEEEEEEAPPDPVLTKKPELIEFVNAAYPQDLLYQGVGGSVVLLIDIDERGRVSRIEVSKTTHPELATPAMVAAASFRFTPAEIDYAPAAIRIEYRYTFAPEVLEPDAIVGKLPPTGGGETRINFRGLVREAGLREPIRGAIIYVSGRPVAETDADGNFELRGVPSGKIELRITSTHHDTYSVDEFLEDNEAIEARYYLARSSRDPFATTIRIRAKRREVSKIQLSRKELTKVPGTSGDPLRVIENLPGTARPPFGFGTLLIRGSNPSDSQVFMDGVEIPILYHFGGLTSVINAAFLEEINHYPGGFGPRFGRAIGGVVEVISRDIDCDNWHGSGQVGFLDGSLYTCLEVDEWVVAGAARRSIMDFFLPWIIKEFVPRREDEGVITATPTYVDYQLKATRHHGRHTLDIFAFGADDRLQIIQTGSFEDMNFNFGLIITWHRLMLRHRLRLGDDTVLTTQITPGVTSMGFEGGSEELGISAESGIEVWNVSIRQELTHKFNDMFELRAGIDFQLGNGRMFANLPIPTNIHSFPTPVMDISASQDIGRNFPIYDHGYWAELTFETDFGLRIVPGFRFDGFVFQKVDKYSFQPRINARWELRDGMVAKAAYGWYEKRAEVQYLLEGFGNPNLEPLRSHQFIIGYEHTFTERINLDVQAYYNLRSQIPTDSNQTFYVDGREIEENFTSDGVGASYGIEVLLRHEASEDSIFYGWLAYTLSRSVRRDRDRDLTLRSQAGSGPGPGPSSVLDELGDEYPSDFDQTHILTLVGQLILPYGFEAGFRFRLVSGNPITPIEDGYVYYDNDEEVYKVDLTGVPRNSGRLPMFHQLDLRVDKTWTFDLWKLTIFLEMLNVYNAANVEQYQYDYRFRERVAINGLAFLPVLGAKGEF